MAFGANDEPVRFAHAEAERLSAALRSAAGELEVQAGSRRAWSRDALAEWRGRFADAFRGDAETGARNAGEFAAAMRQAATQLDELAEAARAEQSRRDRAAAWEAEERREGRLEKAWEWVTGTGEKPPMDVVPGRTVEVGAPTARGRG